MPQDVLNVCIWVKYTKSSQTHEIHKIPHHWNLTSKQLMAFCCCRLLCLRSLFLGDEKISWTLLLRLTLDSSWQSAWETKCCGKTGEMYTQEWKLKSLSVSLQLYEFLKVAALRNKSKCKHVRDVLLMKGRHYWAAGEPALVYLQSC